MKYRKTSDGLVVQGDAFSVPVMEFVDAEFGEEPDGTARFKLLICDPGYGEITKEKWDTAQYFEWMDHLVSVAAKDATIAMWGGIGKPRHRPFLEFVVQVEKEPAYKDWSILNIITWKKKRAYGVQNNYLFTREECAIITRGEPVFNIPLLDEKRGYAGYNKKYPAKSEMLRRSNVWTDVTEMLKGKIHPTQKQQKLYEILIETHSSPGDVIYDPTGGSCTTVRAALELGRRFCVIEKKLSYLKAAGIL